jgi:hypothetical protein
MAFQAPITVKHAIDQIHRRHYVLPAIQREFVWKPDQIMGLFDSLMRGFPIGSFLFWHVQAERRADFQFYNFMDRYHERDHRHNPKADLTGEGAVTAALDGQQRLTSLYIGLRGTYAEKRPYARWDSDAAFIDKRLYLNITRPSPDQETTYEFRFRTEAADYLTDEDGGWFRLGRVLEFGSLADIINFLRQHDLILEQFPQDALTALHTAINDRPILSSYTEESQDLDKVLTIFIRVNSAGTVLSYSDLILSIATAKWEALDAREEIYRLVDELNIHGFAFNKDFVLKSCLMIGGYETRFAADNFRAENMRRIEGMWPGITDALRKTSRLLASFGFTADTLPSANAVIPIAYYLHEADLPANYVDASATRSDREAIRTWLNIALLKRTFTGQPDSSLRAVRTAMKGKVADGFPSEAIVSALRTQPRSMTFGDDELEAVLDGKFSNAYTFATLALLYPNLDFRNLFHKDHVHPRSHFTQHQLLRRGIEPAQVPEYAARFDLIPNLQLLSGTLNQEKSSRPFAEWLASHRPNPELRAAYLREHYIPNEDPALDRFLPFFEARRKLMSQALRRAVGLAMPGAIRSSGDDASPTMSMAG